MTAAIPLEFQSLTGSLPSGVAQQLAAAGFSHVMEHTFSKFSGEATLFLEMGDNGVMAHAFIPESDGGKFLDAPVFVHGDLCAAVALGISELEGVISAHHISGAAVVSQVCQPVDVLQA